MAWSDVNLDVNVLKGLARFDLTDPDGVDPLSVDAHIEQVAKKTVRRRVTVKCGQFVLSEGGQDAFFDALSALATTSGQALYLPVQEMLSYAYLHHFARGENISLNHRLLEDSVYYDQKLEEAVAAFCIIAPVEMVATGSTVDLGKTQSVSVSGAVTFS